MSHEPKQPLDEAGEREWALQERALQAERLSLDARGDDAMQRYRAVARALRQAPDATLSADFAQQVAAQARRRGMASMTFELLSSIALLGALLAMLVSLVVDYGNAWAQAARSVTPLHGWLTPWTLTLMAGLALPALLDAFARARKSKQQ